MTAHEFKDLIQDYITGKISVKEFEKRYNDFYGFGFEPNNERLFNILDRLFCEIDLYWENCQPGQESDFEISEPELRKRAEIALHQLEEYLKTEKLSS